MSTDTFLQVVNLNDHIDFKSDHIGLKSDHIDFKSDTHKF